jgi:hypothetical protein
VSSTSVSSTSVLYTLGSFCSVILVMLCCNSGQDRSVFRNNRIGACWRCWGPFAGSVGSTDDMIGDLYNASIATA